MKEKLKTFLEQYSSCNIKKIKEIIIKYDYISFDIFDTLIKRDVPKPIDTFKLLEKKFKASGFYNDRIAAEEKARKNGKAEVTINDIYSNIKPQYKFLKEKEIEIEKNICTINKDFISIYEYCIKNKKVILTSDMYLPEEVIIEILNTNNINGYTKIYISNKYDKTKANGNLYEYIIADLNINKNQILHIGNSFKADYFKPMLYSIKALKIPTFVKRSKKINKKINYVDSFINNHTSDEYDDYFKFGYERFGILMYGFINWLFYEMQESNVECVYFLARDGYIMKKVYDALGYNKKIQSYYFEASRRSLRIPSYNRKMTYEEILKELTVPNMTNLEQIFDSFGLEINNYKKVLEKYNFDESTYLKRDELKDNNSFHNLYDEISSDIFNNADNEREELKKYFSQFDFDKKVAVVDIGWGGSMQKYLTKTLNKFDIKNDIVGYYFGLTLKSKDNLEKNNLKAKAYLFDCLNEKSEELERPFVGLFETLFLEQDGSVKKYYTKNKKTMALRYPYEYIENGKLSFEARSVEKIHNGALAFVLDFNNSLLSEIIDINKDVCFKYIYETGVNPSKDDIKLFGNFRFFNNGTTVYLAKSDSLIKYLFNIEKLKKDLFDSQWKIGFLKSLLRVNISYKGIYKLLRKISN